jgi:hypothetical protein
MTEDTQQTKGPVDGFFNISQIAFPELDEGKSQEDKQALFDQMIFLNVENRQHSELNTSIMEQSIELVNSMIIEQVDLESLHTKMHFTQEQGTKHFGKSDVKDPHLPNTSLTVSKDLSSEPYLDGVGKDLVFDLGGIGDSDELFHVESASFLHADAREREEERARALVAGEITIRQATEQREEERANLDSSSRQAILISKVPRFLEKGPPMETKAETVKKWLEGGKDKYSAELDKALPVDAATFKKRATDYFADKSYKSLRQDAKRWGVPYLDMRDEAGTRKKREDDESLVIRGKAEYIRILTDKVRYEEVVQKRLNVVRSEDGIDAMKSVATKLGVDPVEVNTVTSRTGPGGGDTGPLARLMSDFLVETIGRDKTLLKLPDNELIARGNKIKQLGISRAHLNKLMDQGDKNQESCRGGSRGPEGYDGVPDAELNSLYHRKFTNYENIDDTNELHFDSAEHDDKRVYHANEFAPQGGWVNASAAERDFSRNLLTQSIEDWRVSSTPMQNSHDNYLVNNPLSTTAQQELKPTGLSPAADWSLNQWITQPIVTPAARQALLTTGPPNRECPAGHALLQVPSLPESYTCDRCGDVIESGQKIYVCQACHYGECSRCFTVGGRRAARRTWVKSDQRDVAPDQGDLVLRPVSDSDSDSDPGGGGRPPPPPPPPRAPPPPAGPRRAGPAAGRSGGGCDTADAQCDIH